MTDGCMDGRMVMWSLGNTVGTRKTLQASEATPAGRAGARSTELAPMPSDVVRGAGGAGPEPGRRRALAHVPRSASLCCRVAPAHGPVHTLPGRCGGHAGPALPPPHVTLGETFSRETSGILEWEYWGLEFSLSDLVEPHPFVRGCYCCSVAQSCLNLLGPLRL